MYDFTDETTNIFSTDAKLLEASTTLGDAPERHLECRCVNYNRQVDQHCVSIAHPCFLIYCSLLEGKLMFLFTAVTVGSVDVGSRSSSNFVGDLEWSTDRSEPFHVWVPNRSHGVKKGLKHILCAAVADDQIPTCLLAFSFFSNMGMDPIFGSLQ